MPSGAQLMALAVSAVMNPGPNTFTPNDPAFLLYQKAVQKILRDEDVTACPFVIPAQTPDDLPREALVAAWRNFVAYFRDKPHLFTEEAAPAAYALLYSFRASSSASHSRLKATPRGRILLKAMQITAGLTLGLLAYERRDRATAVKRYEEALDIAATHPPFATPSVGTERWQIKENHKILVNNDAHNARALARRNEEMGTAPERKEVVDLSYARFGVDGGLTVESSIMFATNVCGNCGKRGGRLLFCTGCKKLYCMFTRS